MRERDKMTVHRGHIHDSLIFVTRNYRVKKKIAKKLHASWQEKSDDGARNRRNGFWEMR